MLVFFVSMLLPLLHDPADSGGDAKVCRCATVATMDGWCAKCHVGYYAGQRIESAALFEVIDLRGHEVFAEKTQCPTCRDKIRDGGFCDACNMGYIRVRGFFSRLCYHLAKGRAVSPDSTRRPCCPTQGDWCVTCRVGVVGNRAFDERGDFDDAKRYFEVLVAALREAKRCEHCAIAMITDFRCHVCGVEYKAGARVASPAERAASRPAETKRQD